MKYERIIYYIIELVMIAFAGVSIYNLVNLVKYHNDDEILRTSHDIGIGCILIFVGFFLIKLYKQTDKMSVDQKSFCLHSFIFLVPASIVSIVSNSKRLEELERGIKK